TSVRPERSAAGEKPAPDTDPGSKGVLRLRYATLSTHGPKKGTRSVRLLEPGHRIDGFVIDECIHSGGMAHIYRVHCADPAHRPDFPIIMKVPRLNADDGAENLVGFEVEKQILSAIHGPHAPRFVAAGDVSILPYLVMEYIASRTPPDEIEPARPRHNADV